MKPLENESGSLLILTLWGMAILSVISLSLTFNAAQHMNLMKREIQMFEQKTDLTSAFNQAVSKVNLDAYAHEDSSLEEWYGNIVLDKRLEGRMTVQVEDEESKINLNGATQRLIEIFLKKLEEKSGPLKTDRKDLIKALDKIRSKKRIQSLEELLLMEDFQKEDYEKIKPYITVYPENFKLNINTVSLFVLECLIESLPGDEGAKRTLLSRLTEACGYSSGGESGRCQFMEYDLYPEPFSDKLKLPRTPLTQSLVQEFLAALTLDSENFRIKITAANGKKAEGVFRYSSGQIRPDLFSWEEHG